MHIWRRPRRSVCQEAGERCEFSVEHAMVYNSPDGQVFRVQRLVCAVCDERVRVARKQDNAFVPPAWLQDDVVEANF